MFICCIMTQWAQGGEGKGEMQVPSSRSERTDYHFVMDPKAQMEFFQKLATVKIGESRQEVMQQLAPPTADQVLTTKKRNKFIFRELRYDVKRWDPELVNERHDRYVTLYFNEDDRLTGARSIVDDHEFAIPKNSVAVGTPLGQSFPMSRNRGR